LSKFVPDLDAGAAFYVAPGADLRAVSIVRGSLHTLVERAGAELGLEARLPMIYLHASVEALRENACVSAGTVAYYDGVIHLSPIPSVVRSLWHEFAHHALLSNSVLTPIWFQEAIAMHFAREENPAWQFPGQPIALGEMVEGYPLTAPREHVEAFYGQAQAMLSLIRKSCPAASGCDVRVLIDALRMEKVAPAALFEWAVARQPALAAAPPLDVLQEFVRRRQTFEPAVAQAIAQGPAIE
jgi:hypothetical protein